MYTSAVSSTTGIIQGAHSLSLVHDKYNKTNAVATKGVASRFANMGRTKTVHPRLCSCATGGQ